MLAEVENAHLHKLCHYQKHVVRNLFTYLIQFSSPNSSLSMLNSSNSHMTYNNYYPSCCSFKMIFDSKFESKIISNKLANRAAGVRWSHHTVFCDISSRPRVHIWLKIGTMNAAVFPEPKTNRFCQFHDSDNDPTRDVTKLQD